MIIFEMIEVGGIINFWSNVCEKMMYGWIMVILIVWISYMVSSCYWL